MNEAERFLTMLFGGPGINGKISVWSKPSKTTSLFSVTDMPAALAEITMRDAASEDVYIGCGTRDPALVSGRGKIHDVMSLPGFWLDIDLQGPAHKAHNLPATLADACEILGAVPFQPTMIVDSGYGLHAWWLFHDPLNLSDGDHHDVNLASRLFQDIMIRFAATKGWHVDKTGDLARVLRVPGTFNYKEGTPRAVTILDDIGPRHFSVDLWQFAMGKSAEYIREATGPDGDTVSPSTPPTLVGDDVSPSGTGLSARIAARGKGLSNAESKALIKKVIAGESFAALGERDAALQRVASIIGFMEPDADAAHLAQVLAPSLSTWETDDAGRFTQQDRIEWATEKIVRAQTAAQLAREARRAQDAEIRSALIDQSRQLPNPTVAPSDPSAARGAMYTDAEMTKFAEQQGCTVPQFSRRWIIQRATSFYVYVNGKYREALTSTELPNSIERDLAAAPIEWFCPKADGGDRRKTMVELLHDYCTVARRSVGALDLQISRYDSKTQTFFEAVCPIRPLTPAFHPQIDQWLTLLGGPEVDKLLDWIATVTRLDRYTCALYLSGCPGTGKGMLSHGLARLWTMGAPTELARVLDQWTADLARCPLVVADEQIPKTFKGQRTSAELRALIGTSSRTLTRKFQANADLQGAVRLILAANHEHLLALGDEDLNANDLEAVAGRFLHIDTPRAARDYLEGIGGMVATDDWVSGDRIACHALWLSKNRTVTPGKRFLVEGKATDMHRYLATQGDIPGAVCEWLARYLLTPTKIGALAGNKIRCGDGRFLVNTEAIAQFWGTYVGKEFKQPSVHRLGRALGNLSHVQTRVGGQRYWDVNYELIAGWAERNQIGDAESVKARVNAPFAPSKPEVVDATGSPALTLN